MNRIAQFTLAVCVAAPAFSQTSVGVSISVIEPGIYGQIDIGRFPQPVAVNPRPIIIAQPQVVVVQQRPVYLYVPPGHQKHWSKHCAEYNACDQQVYFVKESWIRQRYEEQHGHGNDNDKGKSKGKGNDNGKGKHGDQ